MTDRAGTAAGPVAALATRAATEQDAAALVRIEQAAMRTFEEAGIDLPSFTSTTVLGEPLVVVLLDGTVVGYAGVQQMGDWWHLHDVAVDPTHGRRGAGTALLLDVVARAREAGAQGVTLTTFRDVAFNGPWYARHGFRPVPEQTHPWLAAARDHERSAGIDVAPRQAMALAFGPGPVSVRLAGPAERVVVERLAQLEQHDLSAVAGFLPRADGLFDVPRLERFFTDADHNAWLVRSGDTLAGFCLTRPFDDGSTFVHAFFVVRALRRRGVGRAAATELLRSRGRRWSLAFLEQNQAAARFWREVASDVAGTSWAEEVRPAGDGSRTFTFLTLDAGQGVEPSD